MNVSYRNLFFHRLHYVKYGPTVQKFSQSVAVWYSADRDDFVGT